MAIDVPTKRCRPMGRLGFPCSLSVSPYLLFSRRARFHKCYRILSITVRSSLEVKSYVQMLLQCFALPFENYAHGSLAKALFKPLSLCIWLVCTVCSLKVCFRCKYLARGLGSCSFSIFLSARTQAPNFVSIQLLICLPHGQCCRILGFARKQLL